MKADLGRYGPTSSDAGRPLLMCLIYARCGAWPACMLIVACMSLKHL